MTSAASQQHLQNTGQPLLAPIQDIPHRSNRLVQILRDALGGNSVATMVCCLNSAAAGEERVRLLHRPDDDHSG